jgi:hypothetical protein
VMAELVPGDAVVMMSNKGFGMLKQKFLALLAEAFFVKV